MSYTPNVWSSTDLITVEKMNHIEDGIMQNSTPITPTIGPSNIVSVNDALACPAVDATINIEPVQDLHGYDHPWAGGAGKNKFDVLGAVMQVQNCTVAKDNDDGSIILTVDRTNQSFSQFIVYVPNITSLKGQSVILSADTITCTKSGTLPKIYFISLAGSTETILTTIENSSKSATCQIPSDADTAYLIMRADQTNTVVTGDVATFESIMIRLASESDATFAPYSNICPISGWTGANVTRIGKNLFGGVYNEFFPLHFNVDTQVTASADTKGGSGNIQIAFYDSNQLQIDYWGLSAGGARDQKVFTYPATAYYVKFIRTESTNYQIELGSTATSYEPYTGTTIPISWQSEAGTVYGGTLDVTTGLLTVDRALITIDNNSNINIRGRANNKYALGYRLSNYVGAKDADSLPDGWVCDMFPIITGNQNYLNNMGLAAISNDGQINIYYEPCQTIEAWKTFLSTNNVTVAYRLATPQTYQLTPTEVTLLLGENNVWADTGDTILKYRIQDVQGINEELIKLPKATLDRLGAGEDDIVDVTHGGTGATTAAGARSNLGITPANIGAKATQSAVSDPTASGTAITFIDSISQNAQGVISPTKKTVQNASQSVAGLMSAADKKKLDGIAEGAQVNPGNATTSSAGLMSAADKTKLNGIATGAQVNTITGIKGNAESSYRTGNVNLTSENINAVDRTMQSVAFGNSENTLKLKLASLLGTMDNYEGRMIAVYAEVGTEHFLAGATYSGFLYKINENYATGILTDNVRSVVLIGQNNTSSIKIDTLSKNGIVPVDIGGTGATTVAGALANLCTGIPVSTYSSPTYATNVQALSASDGIRCIKYGNGMKRIMGVMKISGTLASDGLMFTLPNDFNYLLANNGGIQGWTTIVGGSKSWIVRVSGTKIYSWEGSTIPTGNYNLDFCYF